MVFFCDCFILCSYRGVSVSCAWRKHRHRWIPICSHRSCAFSKRSLDIVPGTADWSSECSYCDGSKYSSLANSYSGPWRWMAQIALLLNVFFGFYECFLPFDRRSWTDIEVSSNGIVKKYRSDDVYWTKHDSNLRAMHKCVFVLYFMQLLWFLEVQCLCKLNILEKLNQQHFARRYEN